MARCCGNRTHGNVTGLLSYVMEAGKPAWTVTKLWKVVLLC